MFFCKADTAGVGSLSEFDGSTAGPVPRCESGTVWGSGLLLANVNDMFFVSIRKNRSNSLVLLYERHKKLQQSLVIQFFF